MVIQVVCTGSGNVVVDRRCGLSLEGVIFGVRGSLCLLSFVIEHNPRTWTLLGYGPDVFVSWIRCITGKELMHIRMTLATTRRPYLASRHLIHLQTQKSHMPITTQSCSTLAINMKSEACLYVLLAAGLAQSAPLPPHAFLASRACYAGGDTVGIEVAKLICTRSAPTIRTTEGDLTLNSKLLRRQGSSSELATSYAALILADEGVEITADKLNTLIAAAGVAEVEPIWTSLFAKALEGKDVASISKSRKYFIVAANAVLTKYAERSANEYWEW